MDIIELQKRLKRIGKDCFIEHFNLFNTSKLTPKEITKAIQDSQPVKKYTDKSCETRISNSRAIINADMSISAITLIINSRASKKTKQEAQQLLNTFSEGLEPHQQIAPIDDEEAYSEGIKSYQRHKKSERSAKVIRIAKLNRLKETGKLECEVCTFDFTSRYGELGEGFIEAHHTLPVSQMGDNHKTKPEDLALVCSNCHRMLHRHSPLITIQEFKCKYYGK